MFKKTLAVVLCAITAFASFALAASAVVPDAPTGLTMEYGTSLKDVALTGDFVWTSDVNIARYKLGDNTFYAAYDSNNDGVYEAENIAVTVSVVCTKHSWGEWKSDKNEEIFADGTKTRTCKICGKTETVANEGSAKAVVTIMGLLNSTKISDAMAKVIGALVTVLNKLISLIEINP